MPHLGSGIGLGGVATRLFRLLHGKSFGALGMQIADMRLLFIIHAYQRRREKRDFPFLCQHQRNRLMVKPDLVVIERTEGRPFLRRHVILPGLIRVGEVRTVFMREHVENAIDGFCGARIETLDPSFGDRGGDDRAVNKTAGVEISRIFRFAGNLGAAIDAGNGGTNVPGH